jgi:hypothetical protein
MSFDAGCDAMLMRFPGPVTLYPSRRKWTLVLMGCALFTACGVGMIVDKAPSGWLVLLFFLFGVIVAAMALLPGAGSLTLEGNSFEIKNLFRRQRVRWQDATGFKAAVIPPSRTKLVVFDDLGAKDRHRIISILNAMIVGRNGALPDTYGFSADDLAYLMSQWRERATVVRDSGSARSSRKV